MANEKALSNDAFKMIVNVVILILGIILIAAPTVAMQVIITILGIILLAYAIISIVVNVSRKSKGLESQSIGWPVVWLIVGILLLVFNGAFANVILPLVIGVWAIVMGFMNLASSLRIKGMGGSFMVSLILSIIAIVLGIIIIIGIFTAANVVGTLLGVCMLIYGIVSIVNWIANSAAARHL